MRPSPSTSTISSHEWSSPTPYLFIGFAGMIGLIGMALVMLYCGGRKSSLSSISTSSVESEKLAMSPLDMEPRIVIVMAGDHNPSFLAKPVSLSPST